jgi:rhodanese-related sulfurtransferase
METASQWIVQWIGAAFSAKSPAGSTSVRLTSAPRRTTQCRHANPEDPQMKKGIKQLLAEAEAEIARVPAAEAVKMVGQDNVVFVDIRDPREIEREGTIPGAFRCTRGMLEFWIDPDSPYHKPVFAEDKKFVFFCAAGWRSALSAKTAQDMGLADVADIVGGLTAFREAGGPVEPLVKK